MLELELVPEHSLGNDNWEFVLGMHFSQIVEIIQSQIGIIKDVEVLYNDADPLSSDLVINLTRDGIRLIFNPRDQNLKQIEIFNLKLLTLKYCGNVFNSPDILANVEQIEHTFGATHPGIYNNEKQTFTLTFRGLSFMFHIDAQYQPSMLDDKLGSLQFLDGCSPVVSRIHIYSEMDPKNNSEPPLERKEAVEILREKNETLGLSIKSLNVKIFFGDTCQDVCTTLGAPTKIFFKAEDKMKIHSPNAHKLVSGQRKSDFFFNYFTLGLDILFDASTYRAKKFVLHTNYPGHYNFNTYHRCQFSLNMNDVHINAYSKWNEINSSLEASEQPVVLNRTSSTNKVNPFGSTFCYGVQDIIFEIMFNQYISSVTLYKYVV
ncbi:hypothetical protein WDU94_004840 [Cyamophila willieti]